MVRLLEKNPILAKYACENPADSSTNGILHMIPPQAIESVYGDRLASAEGKKIAAALEVQDELTTKEILNSIKT